MRFGAHHSKLNLSEARCGGKCSPQLQSWFFYPVSDRKDGFVAPTLLSSGKDRTSRSTSPLTRASVPSPVLKATYGPLPALLGICVLVLMARPNWTLSPPPRVGSGRGASEIGVPDDRKLLGSIETAGVSKRIVGRVDGKVVLVGWTAFTDPYLSLGRIVILVDGVSHGEVNRFFDRPDVAAIFGRREFGRSGWEIPIPLNGLRAGSHKLAVEAFAETGESSELPAVELRVIE